MEDNSSKIFDVNLIVIENLQDNLNLGCKWLKENNISFMFSKNSPIVMKFNDNSLCNSVANIRDTVPAPTFAPVLAPAEVQPLSLTSSNSSKNTKTDFSNLEDTL